MGLAIPQVITPDSASGAQVIGGSLKFDEDNNTYLKVTPGSAGDRRKWTWSGWVKRSTTGSSLMSRFFMGGSTSVSTGTTVLAFYQDRLFLDLNGSSARITTSRLFRDTGWYHIVLAVDTTIASPDFTRVKIYVNGEQQIYFNAAGYPSENFETAINSTEGMLLGAGRDSSGNEPDGPFDGLITNAYLIDGLQLGAGYFGFTDPLTGTWRPRKFKAEGTTVNDGRVFSSTGTFSNWDDDGSYPKTELFDGTLYTGGTPNGASSDSGSEATFDFGNSQITGFENLQVNIFLSSNQASAANVVSVNGVDITQDCHKAGNDTWTTVDLGSKFTSLKSFRIANNNIYVGGFIIDGVVMKDSTTQNLDFGTNGFYLPLDGSSPIGQDKSGKGNDFSLKRFGGSVELDNPNVSGARPILNTTQGGAQAGVGVFGSKENRYYTTTSGTNVGGKYVFENEGTQPTFSFIRGATYTFDYSASTGHPLRFATAADAAGGTQYTTGTNTSVTNKVSITVPHDAPDTLYYYCTNHSGMGNSISVTTDNTKADQYAANCVLALPLVGGNGDVSDQINCTTSAKTLAVNGDAAASGEASNFYSESFKFDGSGDYLGATSNSDFAMGTGDFTLECWVYRTGGSGFTNYIATRGASGSANGYTFGAQGSSAGYDVEFYTNSLILTGGDQLIYNNKWNHVAVTRTGTTLSTYVNGILNTTTTNSQDFSNTSLAVGITNDASQNPMQGHLCDVRIYKGVAKYSGGSVGDQVFVVPSIHSDIVLDTPSGVSDGSKLTKVTDGATDFNGSNTILDAGSSSDFELSDDHTIEAWIYSRDARDVICGYYYYTNGGQEQGWHFGYNSSNLRLNFRNGNTGAMAVSETGSIGANQWYHVAVVTTGGSSQIYINGKASGAAVDIGTPTTTNTRFTVGGLVFASEASGYDNYFDGYISNLRIIKGTALYSGDFTPPTRTLTEVTNTKILVCQSNTQPGAGVTSPNMGGVNAGTNWSHFLTTNAGDNFDSSGPRYYAFDGNGSNKAYTANNTNGTKAGRAHLQVNFPTAISGALRVKCDNGNTVRNVTSGDTLLATQSTGSDNQYVDCGTVSNLGSLRVLMSGGSRPAISEIELDGVVLKDPISPIGDVTGSNFNQFNTDIDTVRGQESGYATLNPLWVDGYTATLSNGNLDYDCSVSGNYPDRFSTLGMSSGKYYAEFTVGAIGNGTFYGVAVDPSPLLNHLGASANDWSYLHNGNKYNNNSSSSYGASFTAGDTIGIALDLDNHTLVFYKNGKNQGVAYANLPDGTYYFGISQTGTASTKSNFGQKPFKFTPPDGFQPLNDATVRSETVIPRSDQYIGVTTYLGNGGTKTVRDFKFTPDMVWVKSTSGTLAHILQDSVRGFGSDKNLSPDDTAGEDVDTTPTDGAERGYISGTVLNGFTGVDGSGSSQVNGSSEKYIAYAWRAGGAKNTFNVDDKGFANASDIGMNAGGKNNDAYDQSETWSNGVSSSAGAWPGGFNTACGAVTNGFNGDTGNGVCATAAADLIFTNPQTVSTLTGKFEFYNRSDSTTYSRTVIIEHSGGRTDPITLTQNSVWQDMGTYTGIRRIICTGENPGGGVIDAIRIDGKVLVDNGVSVTNAPSIPCTGASVGTKQGFSILTYTGTGSNGSIAHGLSKTPDFVILKGRSFTDNWRIYHKDLDSTDPANYYLMLESSNGKSAKSTNIYQSTTPTKQLFFLGTDSAVNGSSRTMVAYCWHSVPGLQKFGVYEGSNSADGPYVELGFRPAVLWVKRTDSTGNWVILDTTRNTYNPAERSLYADSADPDYNPGQDWADLLSDGFKIRATYGEVNASSGDYVYCAWAEAPSVDLYGGGAGAR